MEKDPPLNIGLVTLHFTPQECSRSGGLVGSGFHYTGVPGGSSYWRVTDVCVCQGGLGLSIFCKRWWRGGGGGEKGLDRQLNHHSKPRNNRVPDDKKIWQVLNLNVKDVIITMSRVWGGERKS